MPDATTINEQGPFYIDRVECVACGACKAVAPELIGIDLDAQRIGEYFFERQPETQTEIEHAIQAIQGCCVDCIYYRGDDPKIILSISIPVVQHCHRSNQASPFVFERSDRWTSHLIPLRRIMTVLGWLLLSCSFLIGVISNHLTNRSAIALYILFGIGFVLFIVGKALDRYYE